jgi:membrane protein implicated in regulation of membrane protease activity
MNWILHISIWSVLALVVIALLFMRKSVSGAEDDTLHIQDAEAGLIGQQAAIARKLEVIDRWGKLFTVLLVVYGLFVAGMFVYAGWVASSTTVVQ